MRSRRTFYGDLHPNPRVTTKKCGKTRYRSRKIAEQARRGLEGDGMELRIYGCPGCGGWHLTSRLTGRVLS